MATRKSDGPLRGVALIKKAIEAAKASREIESPEPVPPAVLKKLRLPNDEKLSPGLKELLAFDASWLGWVIDDEEPELEPLAIDELIEQEFGEDFVAPFGEAIEMLSEDCILIDHGSESRRFLYVGNPDEKGEYAVITVDPDGSWVGGFVPFDVWVAQHLGALESEKHNGYVPSEYEVFCKELAEANSDGRVHFNSENRAGDHAASGDEDDDEDDDDETDEDEDEDEEEGKGSEKK